MSIDDAAISTEQHRRRADQAPAPGTADRIHSLRLRTVRLPLPTPISDAKVLTGRQRPMTEVAMLFAEVTTTDGITGLGFSYSKRAGGPAQFAHAREVAPVLIGEDPNDIARLWTKLVWAGASVGRSGASTQAIAAIDNALYDVKAKRAGLSLAKLLGSQRDSIRCYNTSGGFLHTPIEGVLENASASFARGIGGIKLKVGQPDPAIDLARVAAVRSTSAPGCRSWWTRTSSGTAPPHCASGAPSRSSTWCGSRSPSTPTTSPAMPGSPQRSTPPSPPARCSPACASTSS